MLASLQNAQGLPADEGMPLQVSSGIGDVRVEAKGARAYRRHGVPCRPRNRPRCQPSFSRRNHLTDHADDHWWVGAKRHWGMKETGLVGDNSRYSNNMKK